MTRLVRADQMSALRSGSFDVVVVGGGMTGTSTALDAASRGLRVALLERGDLAEGTSSKSSKMAHGGIRYLRQREFRLVYENLHERQRLLENAPHLVRPLPFLIPLFGTDGVVAKAVARGYRSALWLYDATGGVRIGKRHERLSKDEVLADVPSLDVDRLVAGFRYWDARGDDARIALVQARTAAVRFGAVIATRAEVTGISHHADGRAAGVRVTPRAPGEDQTPFEVPARVVVNATGVWSDEVTSLDEGREVRTLTPAKGVHVTVPAARLACRSAAVLPVPGDRRTVFVVPWEDAPYTYIGTTDTAYDGPLDDPRCLPEDVDYLLGAVNASTSANLTRADVTGVWAGLRPLLADDDDHHHTERTADLSRRHRVRTAEDGVVHVTGGKWTTCRLMAEDTVDEVARQLKGTPRCRTKALPLLGAPTGTERVAVPGIGASLAEHLASRYGTEAAAVVGVATHDPSLLDPFCEPLPYVGAELVYAARSELAVTLSDLLCRRTRAHLIDARAAFTHAEHAARIVAGELGWDDARVTAEVAEYRSRCAAELDAAGVLGPSEVR
ncbi:MAG TPA: glycerol-3-phosphate dehydrogenase/oxidase [Acidimicrobiales bacterium]|nr:glycerol-3-phosphate dehydrogenase/oxidase [Acidimicrobiales bacterium]